MSSYATKFDSFLSGRASELDLPPYLYKEAVNTFQAVGTWLDGGEYFGTAGGVEVTTQGSFEMGTVIRPLKGGNKKAGYDIDLVCRLGEDKGHHTAEEIKAAVGDRLNENDVYARLLDDEGRRCWTLEYADKGDVGFHLDILPCVQEEKNIVDQLFASSESPDHAGTAIAITNMENDRYNWHTSNPSGYSAWFKGINNPALQAVTLAQRQMLFERHTAVFDSVADVPEQLIRSPLQQSIQLLKRHRDLMFFGTDNEEFKPISMIITTLAAKLYQGEPDVTSALRGIVERFRRYADLYEGRSLSPEFQLIRRTRDGWYIANPVNALENFADKWSLDGGKRAESFFKWADKVNEDLFRYDSTQLDNAMDSALSALDENVAYERVAKKPVAAPAIVTRVVEIEQPASPWSN